MRYGFVKQIGKVTFSQQELNLLRASAIRGSHTDIILQEALLDKDYPQHFVKAAIKQVTDDVLMCSFPSLEFIGCELLFRSEFLLLSYCGDEKTDMQGVRDAYLDHVINKITVIKPKSIVYRLCDYNPEEFSFIKHGEKLKLRGAQRLLHSQELLDLDIAVIRAIAELGVPVYVLVPCIQVAQQFLDILHYMRDRLFKQRAMIQGYGVMLELPANLYQVEEYEAADFFVFGPGDLIKFYYGGMDRNDRLFEKIDASVIITPINTCLRKINNFTSRKIVYLAKSLIGKKSEMGVENFKHIDFKDLYLPSQLIERYINTVEKLSQFEKQLVYAEVSSSLG